MPLSSLAPTLSAKPLPRFVSSLVKPPRTATLSLPSPSLFLCRPFLIFLLLCRPGFLRSLGGASRADSSNRGGGGGSGGGASVEDDVIIIDPRKQINEGTRKHYVKAIRRHMAPLLAAHTGVTILAVLSFVFFFSAQHTRTRKRKRRAWIVRPFFTHNPPPPFLFLSFFLL